MGAGGAGAATVSRHRARRGGGVGGGGGCARGQTGGSCRPPRADSRYLGTQSLNKPTSGLYCYNCMLHVNCETAVLYEQVYHAPIQHINIL